MSLLFWELMEISSAEEQSFHFLSIGKEKEKKKTNNSERSAPLNKAQFENRS